MWFRGSAQEKPLCALSLRNRAQTYANSTRIDLIVHRIIGILHGPLQTVDAPLTALQSSAVVENGFVSA